MTNAIRKTPINRNLEAEAIIRAIVDERLRSKMQMGYDLKEPMEVYERRNAARPQMTPEEVRETIAKWRGR